VDIRIKEIAFDLMSLGTELTERVYAARPATDVE
jgi:hypothetical protein